MSLNVQLQYLSKGSMSMMEYIERQRSIADSLVEDLNPIFEEDLISHLLNGLDSYYGAFTTTFMMKINVISVDDLVGCLLQEEARLEQKHVWQAFIPPSSSAFIVNFSNNHPTPSYNSHDSTSHASRNSDSRRSRPVCHICRKPVHKAIDCCWQRSNQTDFPS